MYTTVTREIAPITQNDCFTMYCKEGQLLNEPVHYHENFELNMILNAGGSKRFVGDHIDIISNFELVFINPNLYHGWYGQQVCDKKVIQVSVHFDQDILSEHFLAKKQLYFIRAMFTSASQGILFSEDTVRKVSDRILTLKFKTGFLAFIELLSILDDLSLSTNIKILSATRMSEHDKFSNKQLLDQILEHIKKKFNDKLTIKTVATDLNLPEQFLIRFIKTNTSHNFIDTVNEVRLANASELLIETTYTIAEIAYKCGYNTVSYFNKMFKDRKNVKPKEFRKQFAGAYSDSKKKTTNL